MKYASNLQSGFSLVETFVAITILLIVIVGPLTISNSVSKSTSFSNEQVIAFFLAQEGAEIAQKARDDLQIKFFAGTNPNPWTDFTENSSGATFEYCFASDGLGCGLELNTNSDGTLKAPTDCNSAEDLPNCKLYYNIANPNSRAQYTHVATGNKPSPFTRVVTFEEINSEEIKVVSRVTWRTGSRRAVQEVIVETYLFNVYGN